MAWAYPVPGLERGKNGVPGAIVRAVWRSIRHLWPYPLPMINRPVILATLCSVAMLAGFRCNAQPSDFVGINTPLLFFDAAAQARQVKALKELGVRWVRIDLHWDRLEPRAGQFDLEPLDATMRMVGNAGLLPVVYLVGSAPSATSAPAGASAADTYPPGDPGRYANRMALLAKRYPWVEYWQVWNEPNISTFWKPEPDPALYGALVRAVRLAFDGTPGLGGKKIVLGGMAYYSQIPGRDRLMLQALKDNGTLRLVDVVAYHPYSDMPEGDPDPADPDNFITRARAMNRFLRDAGVKTIWATEFGWSTYTGPADHQTHVSEQRQADYLARRLSLMRTLDFDRVFVFALSDLDARVSERDQHYGLLRLDGTSKPSYQAVQAWILAHPR